MVVKYGVPKDDPLERYWTEYEIQPGSYWGLGWAISELKDLPSGRIEYRDACPEAMYECFGVFASVLIVEDNEASYIRPAKGMMHRKPRKQCEPPKKIISISPMHFSQCPIFPDITKRKTGHTVELPRYTFRRMGDYWGIRFRKAAFYLQDSMGLKMIHLLLRDSSLDKPISCHALHEAAAPRASRVQVDPDAIMDALEEGSLTLTNSDLLNQVLKSDDKARRQYSFRLKEIDEEIRAIGDNNTTRLEYLRREREELDKELGLCNHPPAFATTRDQIRVNVRQCISKAMKMIGKNDEDFESYLRNAINTGHSCCYRRLPDDTISWTF